MSSFISDIESLHTRCATTAYMMRIKKEAFEKNGVLKDKEQYELHKANYVELFKQLIVPVIDNVLASEVPARKSSNIFVNLLNSFQ